MDIDDSGKKFIEKNEGLRLTAYQDGGGIWTIGYGHTGPGVVRGLVVTVAGAIKFLEQDLVAAVVNVNRLVKVGLSQSQFDALVDFTFNLGVKALANSTLLKKLNAGDYAGAAAEFIKWDHIGSKVVSGLLIRRQGEEALFESEAPHQCNAVLEPPIPTVNPVSNTPHTVNWLSTCINEVLTIVEGMTNHGSDSKA